MSSLIFLISLVIFNANAALLERPPPEDRIIDGISSRIEDFPYQVSLELKGRHYCGGSIISEKYILTAAHCVEDIPAKLLRIRVGSTWKGSSGAVYPVSRLIQHEEYGARNDGIPLNDIALIELNKTIEFDSTRKPIELFKTNEKIAKDAKAVASGWGYTGSSLYFGRLQSVTVPIVPQALCRQAYSHRQGHLEPSIPDGQICAGFLGVGGKDACQGDSGGPLAIDGRLAGVVSWGEGCAERDFPGVYTEVAYYRDWIKENAKV